jgi:CHAD domain-containing protein
MDSRDLLLDLLDERGATYVKKAKRCRDDFSTDAIHDLRTSIRRLLAILEVAAFVTSAAKTEKISDRLKEQLDGCSDLRDIQVMLDTLAKHINTLPQLGPFQAYLRKREKRRQRFVEKHIQDIKPGGVSKRLKKIRAAVQDLSAGEVSGKLPQAVDEAHLTVLHRYGEIDPTQPASIHRLRVAFKKFRYIVEAIHPCLPNFPETLLERMQKYQTRMGDVHDIEVLLKTLAKFADKNESYDPVPVRSFYESVLDEAVAEYMKNKDAVLTFWRATPLEAFAGNADPTKKEERL